MTTILLSSCGSVPFTGRRQLQLVSNDEVIALSLQQYQEFMRSAPLENGTNNAQMVTRIGSRIAKAVETFTPTTAISRSWKTMLGSLSW